MRKHVTNNNMSLSPSSTDDVTTVSPSSTDSLSPSSPSVSPATRLLLSPCSESLSTPLLMKSRRNGSMRENDRISRDSKTVREKKDVVVEGESVDVKDMSMLSVESEMEGMMEDNVEKVTSINVSSNMQYICVISMLISLSL